MKGPPPPDYLKRLASDRIFSTLFYPNALAGALLLMMPPILVVAGGLRRLTIPARAFVALVIGVGGFACLYWSGSKAGWLLMMLLGIVVLLRLPLGARFKAGLAAAMLAAGLAGFFWHHAAFFAKGATSAVARLDYWRAAVRIAKHRPLVGSAPAPLALLTRPSSALARSGLR